MLSAFALTNCTQEIENPAQQPESAGYPFEIVASTADTKTVNDGMSTKWAEGDQINLFHIEDSDEAEVKNDGAFTVSDIDAGTFTGNLSEPLTPEAEYAWYAFYPYSSYIETPANTSKGWMPVGSKSNEKQVQTGNNNMDHIAGPNYPMAGWAETYPDEPTPNFTMYHLTSLIEINVTNDNDEALTVDEIAFTAPVNIIGTYLINFASPWGIDNDPDAFTPSNENYVSKTATLKVNNATALAKGESAKFYLGIKPFIAESGAELILSVNGYSKEIKLSSEVAFRYGKIKTLNFGYDYVETEGVAKAKLTFDDAAKRIVSTTSQQVWKENEVTLTYNKAGYANDLAEYANPVRFYKGTTITIEVPGNMTEIEFDCNTEAYASTLNTSIKESSVSGKKVTIGLDGTSKSVTYTMSEGQVRMDALTVTYTEGEGGEIPETKVLESIAVSEPIVSYNVGDNFVKPVVIATYSDASTADVTESATFSGYDMATAGTQTVTVSYTEDDIIATTEYEITVNAVEVETITATIEDFLAITEENANTYIVTGKIVNIEEISSQYKNATLTIADDNGNELYIYRMKAAEGGDAIEALGLTLGDILTVSGKWGIHGGVVQLVSGVYVNHEDQEAPEQDVIKAVTIAEFLTAPVSTVTKYRLTGEIVLLEAFNTQYNNVSLTISDGTGEAYVYRMSAPEGKVINELGLTVGDILTVEGNRGAYNNAPQMTNAVYISHDDVEVEEPEVPAGSVVAQAVFAELGYTNSQSVDGTEINLDENVTIVFKKGSAGTAPAYYTSGSAIRLYQNGATLDVTANGKMITEIELTFSQNHYYIAPDCGTLSAEASVRTWTGESTSVKFTTTGTDKNHRAYLAAIKVTYAE